MAAQSIYGVCNDCDYPFSPVPFLDEERDKHNRLTGRVRKAVSHLVCECCGKNSCVDDTFDGPWYFPNSKKERQYVQNRISG